MTSNGATRRNRQSTLLRGIQSIGLGVLYLDAELSVRLVENLPPSWPDTKAVTDHGMAAVFDPFTRERILAAKREVLASGAPKRFEAMQRRPDGPPIWFELSIERDDAEDGGVRGLFVSISDVSDTKARETALRELLHEVSHRSRNLLAILQGILGQTARRATSVAEFEAKFRGRIASLAASQDLITFANWEGVRLDRLIEAQTAARADEAGVTIEREGANLLLDPNTTLHLGLALHELAENSAAHGTLAAGEGRLRIACTPHDTGSRFEWLEDFASPASALGDWGFGRTILQNAVPRALGVVADYVVAADGVTYALDLAPRESAPRDSAPGA